MSIKPTQIRTIDPFSDYNSNVTNRLTRFVTRGENCVHGPHGVDVSINDGTSATLLSGYCFKDDVLINLSENTTIDFSDVNSYFVAGIPLNENGYYYICLKYSYIKTRDLPEVEVGILRPTDRPLLESTIPYVYPTPYMLLKVVQVVGGVLTEVFNFDPEYPTRKRKFSQTYVSLEDTLPTPFDRTRDEGRLILCLEDGEFYFGTWNAWVNFNTSHAVMKTNELGIEKGDIVYINDNDGKIGKALATDFTTFARAAVLTVGDTLDPLAPGKVCLFGKVEQVNLETGITVSQGDTLFLSEIEAGKVTNVAPASYQQFLGTSLTSGDTTAQIWFIPNLKGGGTGSGSLEDTSYALLLELSSFEKLYYDIFTGNHTVTASGAEYKFSESCYLGTNGDYIISPQVLDSTSTIYKFFVTVDKDETLDLLTEYSIDGTNWITISLDSTISINSGFNQLEVKFTWLGDGRIYSFGVLYKESLNSFMTDTKMLKKYVATTDLITPTLTIPENATYINDGKSLAIYRNGIRLIKDVHYTELDNSRVTFLTNILQNDILIFEELYGYVDVSFDNKNTLDGILAKSWKLIVSTNAPSHTLSGSDATAGSFIIIDDNYYSSTLNLIDVGETVQNTLNNGTAYTHSVYRSGSDLIFEVSSGNIISIYRFK